MLCTSARAGVRQETGVEQGAAYQQTGSGQAGGSPMAGRRALHGGVNDLTDNPPARSTAAPRFAPPPWAQQRLAYLGARPLKALGGAIALGFVLGRLLR